MNISYMSMSVLVALLVGVVWLGCATTPRYWLEYEQSGGVGGVREYRLRIDTNSIATLERWSGWLSTTPLQQKLSRHDYHTIGKLCAQANIWQLDTLYQEPSLHPDSPIAVLTYRETTRSKRMTIRGHAPESLRQLFMTLDSLVQQLFPQ